MLLVKWVQMIMMAWDAFTVSAAAAVLYFVSILPKKRHQRVRFCGRTGILNLLMLLLALMLFALEEKPLYYYLCEVDAFLQATGYCTNTKKKCQSYFSHFWCMFSVRFLQIFILSLYFATGIIWKELHIISPIVNILSGSHSSSSRKHDESWKTLSK